jgi:hypothetical protein
VGRRVGGQQNADHAVDFLDAGGHIAGLAGTSTLLHPGRRPVSRSDTDTTRTGDSMKAFTRFTAVASMAFLAAAPALGAQTLPAASEIVAKHVAAIGGKDAIMKIQSMQQTGSMKIPTMGLEASMEVHMAPNRMAMKQSIPGMGEIVTGFDGTNGWSVNPMQGPRLMTGKELDQLKEQADFPMSMLYAPDRYASMQTEGIVDFAGEKAYKVKLVRKSTGRASTEYFSVASGLQIGGEMTQESEMGTMQVTSVVSEYKDFGGIKIPTKVEQSVGPTKIEMQIADVKINAVPATAFEPPAQVKALIKP